MEGNAHRQDKLEPAPRSLLYFQQLDFKNKRAVRRDRGRRRIIGVREIGRDFELEFVADFHQLQPLNPAGNELIDRVGQRFSCSIGAVEYSSVREASGVINYDSVGGFGRDRSRSSLQDLILQATGGAFPLCGWSGRSRRGGSRSGGCRSARPGFRRFRG